MIVDRALVPEVMVMVDHTLIDVPLANIYLDSYTWIPRTTKDTAG